jgi:hypothetical protein
VKVVQQMLGHKSATMTLDQYGTCSVTSWTRWLIGWTRRGVLLLPRSAVVDIDVARNRSAAQ